MLSCKLHSHPIEALNCIYTIYSALCMQEQTVACSAQQWANCFVTSAVFDVRWNSRFGAMLNLVRSTFVIVALGCGAVLFNNDSNRLVLRPIERMLRKVSNPLSPPALLVGSCCATALMLPGCECSAGPAAVYHCNIPSKASNMCCITQEVLLLESL